jgi:hypothetical protein
MAISIHIDLSAKAIKMFLKKEIANLADEEYYKVKYSAMITRKYNGATEKYRSCSYAKQIPKPDGLA